MTTTQALETAKALVAAGAVRFDADMNFGAFTVTDACRTILAATDCSAAWEGVYTAEANGAVVVFEFLFSYVYVRSGREV